MRRSVVALALLLTTGVSAGPALAAWLTSGVGSAAVAAGDVAPVAETTAYSTVQANPVTVSWAPADPARVDGYTVARYPAAGGAATTPGAGCAGTVTSTTCQETAAPEGRWIYRVTPHLGLWTGTGGPESDPVAIAPTAPTMVRGLATSPTDIQLTVTDRSTSETHWRVERRTPGHEFDEVASHGSTTGTATGSDVTLHGAGGLACDTTYDFRVRAHSETFDLTSLPSATATVTTGPCVRPAVSVSQLTGASLRSGNTWTATFTMTLASDPSGPVGGARVHAELRAATLNDGSPTAVSCLVAAGATGCAISQLLDTGGGNEATLTITGVTLAGHDYDAAASQTTTKVAR